MQLLSGILIYIITSMVPANSTQFRLEAVGQGDKKAITECMRVADKWVVTKSVKEGISDKGMKFYVEGTNIYIQDPEASSYKKIDFSEKVNLVPNHKKWKKVTQVVLKWLEEGKEIKPMVFKIVRKDKNTRVIRFDPANYPDLAKEMGEVTVSWK